MLVPSSLNTALTAYLTLKWSTLVILYGINKNIENCAELAKLIEAQANLSAASLASTDKKLTDKTYTLLAHEWSSVKDIEIKYVETLVKLEIGNGVIVLASLLTKYLVNAKKSELIEQLKVIINVIQIISTALIPIFIETNNIFFFSFSFCFFRKTS